MLISYPPAPWRLRGRAVVAYRLVPTQLARRFVPEGLDLVSILPGRTLAVLYCASYSGESSLHYHELIVCPAIVRVRLRAGAWISHIFVDSTISRDGGREIWGLPKEIAQFTAVSRSEERWDVRTPNAALCSLLWQPRAAFLPAPLVMPAFALKGGALVHFTGFGTGSAVLRHGRVDVPSASPFAALEFNACRRLMLIDPLRLTIDAPHATPGAAA